MSLLLALYNRLFFCKKIDSFHHCQHAKIVEVKPNRTKKCVRIVFCGPKAHLSEFTVSKMQLDTNLMLMTEKDSNATRSATDFAVKLPFLIE